MATVEFEAWLNQTAPIEIATPIYQSTATVINFTVLNEDRVAVDLTSYAFKFAAKDISDGSSIFDVTCTAILLASGTIKATLSTTNLANEAECLGELRLFSGGDAGGDCTDRVQFRFDIVGKVA